MGWLDSLLGDDGCRCYVAAPDPEDQPPQARELRKGVSFRVAGFATAGTALLASLVTAAVLKAPQAAPAQPAELAAPLLPEPVLLPISDESALRAQKTEYMFGELTAQEARAVARYTAEKLGCKTGYSGDNGEPLKGCFLSGSEAVTLMLPPKEAAISYLDGHGPAPPRMAQAIVVHGERKKDEGVGIYSVGPLDGGGGLAGEAKVELIKSHHLNRRPLDMSDSSVEVPIAKVIKKMKHILLESFGGVFPWLPEDYKPKEDGTVFLLMAVNQASSLKQRITRAVFNWYKELDQFQVNWMHTIPFLLAVVQDGDVDDWYVTNITYCGQTYKDVEELLRADEHGTLYKCKGGLKSAGTWDNPGPNNGTLAMEQMPPPTLRRPKTWQTIGNGAIRWGDWEIFATVRPGSGLALHDVRWRGERIAYELALSDAQAYYSSTDSGHQFHYSDKAFSLSQISGELVEGLDCPHGATFFTNSIWILSDTSDPARFKLTSDPTDAVPQKLMCVYEGDSMEGSMWRHAQLSNRKVTGRAMRNLVVRTVSTVGNYDYISEVHFGEDGAMHVRNEFAGYPEVEHTPPYSDPPERRLSKDAKSAKPVSYGTRVRGDLIVNLHSHFVVWKVDLDVLGTKNEFRIVRSAYDEQESKDGTRAPRKMQIETLVEKEDPEAKYIANAATPSLWRFVNAEEPNPASGVPRGYAIVMNNAPALQTLPDDHPYTKASAFAKRHLTVTKRHEDEPHCVHSLDHYPIPDPLLSVEHFLADKENIVGEDLVAWVSLGKEHVTRSEDVPLISNFGVQFALMPWNYNVINPVMQMPMIHP